MNTFPHTANRTDWLNLARENAIRFGDDPADLGRAIVRLATLAAAAHPTRAIAPATQWTGHVGTAAAGSAGAGR